MKAFNGLHVYHPQHPLDYWKGWVKVTDSENLSQSQANFLEQAKLAVASIDFPDNGRLRKWEGDMRECYFARIQGGQFAVAWKQDNNGETFMAFSSEPDFDFGAWNSCDAPLLFWNQTNKQIILNGR